MREFNVKSREPKVSCSFYITASNNEKLAELAAHYKTSRSEILNQLVEDLHAAQIGDK